MQTKELQKDYLNLYNEENIDVKSVKRPKDSEDIKIYKDFHDFTLMLGVRDRNQNLSFNFMINIRCGGKDEEQTQTQKRVSNYYCIET